MVDDRDKTIRLADVIAPVRRNWILVLASLASVLATVGILTIFQTPVYEAWATLWVRESSGRSRNLFQTPQTLDPEEGIKDQTAVLRSRSIAEKVIVRLEKSAFRDSLSILGRISRTSKPRPGFAWFVRQTKKTVRPNPLTTGQYVARFQKQTFLAWNTETNLITLKAHSATSWEASLLVNAWMDVYQETERADRQEELTLTRTFLENKLGEIEKKLAHSEDRLTRYQKDNNVVSLPAETEKLVKQLAEFETAYNQTRTELEGVQNQLSYLKGRLDDSNRNLVENMVNLSGPVIEELQREMANVAVAKANFEAQLIEAGYDVEGNEKRIQMENQLKSIQDKIVQTMKTKMEDGQAILNPVGYSETLITQVLQAETSQKALQAKTKELGKIVSRYNQKMETLPLKNLDLARLERDVAVGSKIYLMLREKAEETRIQEVGRISSIRVVDRASDLSAPVSPRPVRNVFFGGFLGLVLGIGLAYSREFFRSSINRMVDLKKFGYPVLGMVPSAKRMRWRAQDRGRDWSVLRARGIFPYLLLQENGYSRLAESFRTIRTSVVIANREKRLRSVLFTSADSSEGKSTTVANLGIAMARKGIQTLLVDTDLRRPVLDVLLLGARRNKGLTDCLIGSIPWRDSVRETSVAGLFLIPAGFHVKQAPELLGGRRMKVLLEEWKRGFGVILFDSPPLLPVTDAAVLASLVDGVVLVVRAGKTSRDNVDRALDILTMCRTRILGTVLTGVRDSDLYGATQPYKTYDEIEPQNQGKKVMQGS